MPTQAALKTEALRRVRSRRSLVDYSQAIVIPGAPMHPDDVDGTDPNKWVFEPIETRVARHHKVTMEAIQRCIETDGGRLMIFEPPGSAKSTYACVVATSWYMGKSPGSNTLMVSSSGTPIIRASKKARQICLSPEFRNLWPEPTFIPKGSSASDEWALTNGATMFAAGILGGIVGSRADLAIIDDPVAGREEADSETIRKKIRAAYEDDVLTRLKPKASLILIQTRWHELDLAGSILPDDWNGESGDILCKDGQVWHVLRIPAECDSNDDPLGREIGEMLWPEWFTEQHWANFRINPRTWGSLFQQTPKPQSGGQFEKDWFHRFARAEIRGQVALAFGTSDWAVTKKTESNNPDETVHGDWRYDSAGELWLVDGWHGQKGPVDTISEWLRLLMSSSWGDYFAEAGVIRKAIEPMVHAAQNATRKFVTETYLPATADKITNAQAFRSMAQHGQVHIVKGPFGDWLIDQLCGFPYGRFDDGVDMCGLAGRAVDYLRQPEDEAAEKAAEVAAKRKASVKPFTEQAFTQMKESDEARARFAKRFKS